MNSKQYFEKHHTKLLIEAWLRSLLSAFCCGFIAVFISALVTWFLEFKGLWLTVSILFVVTAAATPVFFFLRYRPSAVSSARRLDLLGLEERLVTMLEYENDESPVAVLQRQDAKYHLQNFESKKLKIKIPNKIFVILAITATLGAAMTTVSTLSDMGVLPGGFDFLEEIIPEEKIDYVLVTYEVEEGGSIDGEADQLIPVGTNTEMVVAVPDDGWTFVEWDDGYKKPARFDKKIGEDRIYIAIFAPLDADGNPSDEGSESDEKQDNGKPQDKPSDEQDKPQQGDQENPSDEQEKDEEQQKPTTTGGGKYEEANQVIDGETYYKEVLDEYREMLRERLEKEGDQLSEEERSIIEAYLGIV